MDFEVKYLGHCKNQIEFEQNRSILHGNPKIKQSKCHISMFASVLILHNSKCKNVTIVCYKSLQVKVQKLNMTLEV